MKRTRTKTETKAIGQDACTALRLSLISTGFARYYESPGYEEGSRSYQTLDMKLTHTVISNKIKRTNIIILLWKWNLFSLRNENYFPIKTRAQGLAFSSEWRPRALAQLGWRRRHLRLPSVTAAAQHRLSKRKALCFTHSSREEPRELVLGKPLAALSACCTNARRWTWPTEEPGGGRRHSEDRRVSTSSLAS